jgi:hypothetical protein
VNKYVKAVQAKLAPLDYAARAVLLKDVIQNMNERAESSNDMQEIAAFLVAQLGGDAEEVVTGYQPDKVYEQRKAALIARKLAQ